MTRIVFLIAAALLLSTSVENLFAAACCASSSTAPNLILDDAKAQTAFTASYSDAIGNSRDDGSSLFFSDSHSETTLRLRISQAVALGERWQVFAALQALRASKTLDRAEEANWALADTAFGAAHELVPEYTYHPLRPRVFLSAAALAPTGKPTDQSLSALGTDSSGLGAWGFSLGAHALKTWTHWDAALTVSHARYAPTRRALGRESVLYTPGASTAGEMSIGGRTAFFGWPARLGFFAGPEWQAAGSTALNAETRSRLLWNVGVSCTLVPLAPEDNWSMQISYDDQTLLGPTRNATLARAVALQLARRFGE